MKNLGETGFNDSHIHGLSCYNVLAYTPSTFITKTQLFKFVKYKEGGWVGGALGGSERPTGVEIWTMVCMMGSYCWNCGQVHSVSITAVQGSASHDVQPLHIQSIQSM